MSIVSDVVARLEALVPSLAGRVGTAFDLGLLMGREVRLAASPYCWVLPGAIVGQQEQGIVGAYRQTISRQVSVVIAMRAYDGQGAADRPDLEALIAGVMSALAGYEPPSIAASARGTMTLVRGDLVSIRSGIVIYALDFAVEDEWRSP
ncbi:hypothetical protein LV82_02555 [Albidovulum inexpectatum]|uniref:Gp37 protein n=1 Tax=Albidovulum inexpectatum TaxID=196587 RepID=A0A2S5JE27_9RHOB|nr:hypothetical protein [Albidovulum inexpectatum]PPB79764.1 hypothetical protein LV82_02555 [Albidovulum inexpectatum]